MCSHACHWSCTPLQLQLPERAGSIWGHLQWSWKQVQIVCWEAGGKWGRVICDGCIVLSVSGCKKENWVFGCVFFFFSNKCTMRQEILWVCFHQCMIIRLVATAQSIPVSQHNNRRVNYADDAGQIWGRVLEEGMIEWERRGVKHQGDQLFQFSVKQFDGWTAVSE